MRSAVTLLPAGPHKGLDVSRLLIGHSLGGLCAALQAVQVGQGQRLQGELEYINE